MSTYHDTESTLSPSVGHEAASPPRRWSRLRCAAIALTLGMLTAIVTSLYVAFVSGSMDSRTFVTFMPFVIPAAIVGVAPPAYVALDLGRRSLWLQAAAATSVAALVAFVVFWSAAVVATPGPLSVRMASDAVVVAGRFDRAGWLASPAQRQRMVQDLMDSGRLKGMSAAQVTAELGGPAHVEQRDGMRALCYSVGVRAGRALDFDVLLGSDGHVQRTELVASK